MLTVFGYTTHTLVNVWHFWRLNQQIEAQDIQWKVISKSEEAFILFASYSFVLNGKKYQGETRWKQSYLNQWTAEEAIIRLKKTAPLV